MKTTKAFTLIEILVVATIIILLSVGGVVTYSQFGKQSRDARRKADIEQVRAALEMYKSNNVNSSYPTAEESLNILVTNSYLKAIPLDPKTKATYITYTAICSGTPSICTTYTLEGQLEDGTIYQTDPLGGSIILLPTPTTPPKEDPNCPLGGTYRSCGSFGCRCEHTVCLKGECNWVIGDGTSECIIGSSCEYY